MTSNNRDIPHASRDIGLLAAVKRSMWSLRVETDLFNSFFHWVIVAFEKNSVLSLYRVCMESRGHFALLWKNYSHLLIVQQPFIEHF
jgi:hypothetical protein